MKKLLLKILLFLFSYPYLYEADPSSCVYFDGGIEQKDQFPNFPGSDMKSFSALIPTLALVVLVAAVAAKAEVIDKRLEQIIVHMDEGYGWATLYYPQC